VSIRPRRTALAVAALAVLAACGGDDDPSGPAAAADIDVDRGEDLFAANCAVCHGPVGEGAAAGPPLVHRIYEPSHHSDESFQIAVARGVQPHHWNFGPMPPIDGLDRDDVADITAWVRERQREAGIE
jgi:mono/diheme cytochrome c family protein